MTLQDKIKSIFKPDSQGESSSSKKMHATATHNGIIIAETDHYETVEGNVYFPPESLKKEYFTETDLHTGCPWKGEASYYTIDLNDGTGPLTNSAWFYPQPKPKAEHIKDHVAFYANKVHINKT
ncbi:hypothetical protein ABW20_dc0108813 [Dactylellina cionopaga]|nr:hypothetical protein ABW20_dc0108813 [Dactylellina cionopaga]